MGEIVDVKELMEKLQEPFDPYKLGWKPQNVMKDGKSCIAVPYIDARDVQDRLDLVVGPTNWENHFETSGLGSNCVLCTLRIRINGEWIEKEDVGAPSEQPDAGDKIKAAHSDALKRAAVQWGIARYVYAVPTIFLNLDDRKRLTDSELRRAVSLLPDWAWPKELLAKRKEGMLKNPPRPQPLPQVPLQLPPGVSTTSRQDPAKSQSPNGQPNKSSSPSQPLPRTLNTLECEEIRRLIKLHGGVSETSILAAQTKIFTPLKPFQRLEELPAGEYPKYISRLKQMIGEKEKRLHATNETAA